MKKSWIFVLSFLVLIGLLFTSIAVDRTVQFKDANLEFAIREILGYSGKPIHKSQLLNITELDLSNRGISSLEGIEYFRNLKTLNLSNNLIQDLAPLAKMPTLRDLNLANNQLVNLKEANLSLLKHIPLKSINLNFNIASTGNGQQETITDISLLSEFSGLEALYLSGVDASDYSPIRTLNKLKVLELQGNEIKDVSFLEGMNSLQVLNLRDNDIRDLTSLSQLMNVNYLNLHSNKNIQSIEPISTLEKLEKLILRNVPLGDQTNVLLNFHNLQYLNIRACDIKDMSFLAEIMARGTLQDNPEKGIRSYLDIRDNPLPETYASYSALVPYWDNIHIKYPILLLDHVLEAPVFSHTAGFYQEPVWLSITTVENTTVYYTLDGSLPTMNSFQYTQPILIQSRTGKANLISTIDTISYRYQEPEGEVFKVTTVRARAFENNSQAVSPVITHTYLVDEDIHERYSVPIISLVTEPTYFFDSEQGIYVTGEDHQVTAAPGEDYYFWPANYHQDGEKWERPIHIEYFTEDGDLAFAEDAGIRIHGAASRSYSQKSMRLYADADYETTDLFRFDFFQGLENPEGKKIDTFETLILRNSGSDWPGAFMRDVLVQSLVAHTSLETQAYRPVVIFLNGEYWGLYNIRERYDPTYFENYYGIDPQDLVILEQINQVDIGTYEDVQDYQELIGIVNILDQGNEQAFSEIENLIDVDNYIDYQVVEIYSANRDWPTNNIKYWRMRRDEVDLDAPIGQDGRWRWLLFDTDDAFIYFDEDGLSRRIEGDDQILPLRSLLVHEGFKIRFINRFADHMNTTFKPERVIQEIDRIAAVIAPEMDEQIARWHSSGGSVESWQANVEELRTFAQKRPAFMIKYLLDYFNLAGTYELSVECNPDQGHVQVNSIDITVETPGIEEPGNWSGTYFQGVPLILTAIPRQGFTFSHWEGIKPEDAHSVSITIDPNSNISLKAIFVPMD